MTRFFRVISNKITIYRTNKFWNRLINNMISALIGESGASVVNLIITVIIIRIIGNNSYGALSLAVSYMTIVDSLVNFQSWQAIIKYGSDAIVHKDYIRLAAFIKMGTIVDGLTAVAGVVVAIVSLPAIAGLLNWNDDIKYCAYIVSLEILFHFSGTSTGVMRMLNKFKLVAIQKITVALIKLFLIIIYSIFFETNLHTIAAIYTIADILGHLSLTIMSAITIIKSRIISIRDIIHGDVKPFRKDFWGFVVWTNLTTSIDIPVKEIDVFVLSTISLEVVAVFNVYKKLGKVLVKLSTPLSQAILPQFSELVASNEIRKCYDIMIKIKNSILKVLIPLSVLVTAGASVVLYYIIGPIYAQYFYVLLLYLLSRSFSLSYTTIHPLFISLGFVRKNFIFALVSNIFYIVLVLSLTKIFGILGVVIALFGEYFMIISLKKMTLKKYCTN